MTPDLLVIGAGSGGLSVAAGAVQLGASVVLVEGGHMGGDCLNHGCVPSKALIAAAARAQAVRTGGLGTTGREPDTDYAAAMAHVARTIRTIAPIDSQERFESLGVNVLRDWARFTGPREVTVGEMVIRARRVVVATGSGPTIPPIAGLDAVPYLTNETLFAQRERPGHLLILGGGPVGIEMAQAHRRLGSEVTVVTRGRALGREDRDAAVVVLDALRGEGVRILEGVSVTEVRGQGGISLDTSAGVLTGTHLLIATGRFPRTAGLGLDVAGIQTDGGWIRTDDRLRTSNRHVFAVGDITGRPAFTHAANHQAGVVIRQALFGLPARIRDDAMPRVTYADPELAQIGLTEAEARTRFGTVEVVRQHMAENDRAQAEGRTDGFLKLVVHRGRPVGVTIVGPGSGEMIGLWAVAMTARVRFSALAGTILPYPTRSELSKRAVGTYLSSRVFDNPWVKRVVRIVQSIFP